ncbi:nickel pincer cofactor biosynthesis protein LarB [Maribellus comscasis]|uniref:Nickel pincer cofactor biosynthesis protein LarB n=1 Tax=Maribellus comscasis TaxID=2681766 RepID=A0A6I6JQR9_9BACT|nr:nickel pincer cofactor biosynthesis protein LarB [Maribellus comscasis]QGY43390.1 nickel pincer cofactor biosynthesis protein LarB [Maribellus comscasis]
MGVNELLKSYKSGKLGLEETLVQLKEQGIEDLGFAKIDSGRLERTGIPEVIYSAGKTKEQVQQIAERMYKTGIDILATRASEEIFQGVTQVVPGAVFNPQAKTIVYHHKTNKLTKDYIAVVAAGTSDLPVAEEAVETANFLGNKVERIYDVGVAGIHRLFSRMDLIRGARVIIVVAGMEGALPSVIGGLVDKPVIAVPTSVGYGANLGGVTALLAMLNSCAAGISVVNIDNGFGAACQAGLINKLK